jgi:hypothetical protein
MNAMRPRKPAIWWLADLDHELDRCHRTAETQVIARADVV